MCQPPSAARRQPNVLLRVEFDDELFLNGQADVFPLRKIEHRSAELFGIELQPGRDAAATGRLHSLLDLLVLPALLANLNHIPLANLIGGDVDLLSIHLDVSVTDQLARLGARGGESERVDDVVEPKFELAEKVVTGDAVSLRSAPEVVPELTLDQS